MAAETIREFMETGTIRNSVNFPSTALPQLPDKSIRMNVVNRNVPGALAQILDVFAKHKLNIIQQINQSKGDIAYNVLDFDPVIADGSTCSLNELQKEVTMLSGVLSSRVLFGTPGTGYARQINEIYHVWKSERVINVMVVLLSHLGSNWVAISLDFFRHVGIFRIPWIILKQTIGEMYSFATSTV